MTGVICATALITHCAGAAVNNVSEVAQCAQRVIASGACAYLPDTLAQSSAPSSWSGGTRMYGYGSAQECFNSGSSETNVSDYCYVGSTCVGNNQTGHDSNPQCSSNCADMGYNVLVFAEDINANTLHWTCACARDTSFVEWRTYKTGVLRRYEQSAGSNCVIQSIPLNEYKCAAGYYGPNNNPNGCKACPANASCYGGTAFGCNNGYYKNSTLTGCERCPDSKEAGLGWGLNGNGIAASGGGDYLAWCAIESGTRLYDATGTFIMDPDYELTDGCEY